MSYKVLYFPSAVAAEKYKESNNIDISIEMEYGDVAVTGSLYTAVHHGKFSENPAPCEDEKLNKLEIPTDRDLIIGVSHIDLDTVLGILHSTKDNLKDIDKVNIDDKDFSKAAGYIDVNGPHNLYNVSKQQQELLTAYNFWAQSNRENLPRDVEYLDVTDKVQNIKNALEIILDEKNPEHNKIIEQSKAWQEKSAAAIENCLYFENQNVRAFVQNGDEKVFCASAYYSPTMQDCATSTITYNKGTNSITIGFKDGEKVEGLSAKEIVQELWGPGAGGRKGIAGSPRNQEMTMDDFKKALDTLQTKIIERDYNKSQLKNEKEFENFKR